MERIRKFIAKNSYSVLLDSILMILIIIMSVSMPKFLSIDNFLTVLTRISEEGIIAVGVTIVVILGGIDLSVGSVMAMVPIIVSVLYSSGTPFIFCLLIACICGITVGLFNAFLIQKMSIQPMIATLATMTITRSIAYVLSGGKPLNDFPDVFFKISKGQLFGVRYPVYILLLFSVAGTFVLNRTRTGRFIYAVGGNELAAKSSGINTDKVKYMGYVFSAICSSLAGIMLASRLNTANSSAGSSTALDMLTAVLLGGTSFKGGEGNIPGTIVGVLIMSLLVNGFNLLNISSYWQMTVMGILLILIVGIDSKRRSRGI